MIKVIRKKNLYYVSSLVSIIFPRQEKIKIIKLSDPGLSLCSRDLSEGYYFFISSTVLRLRLATSPFGYSARNINRVRAAKD